MIKAIILDCFGVVISDALSVMCNELLISDPVANERVWDLIAQTNKGLMSSDESSRQIGEIFGMTLDTYRTKLQQGETKDVTLLSYTQGLRTGYKTAMLSNVGVGSLARRFAMGELEQYFDVVVASGDIGYAKPEPEAYEIVAERLGVRLDECVFADDKEQYCAGATAVGMQAILYKDFAQFRTQLELLLAANS